MSPAVETTLRVSLVLVVALLRGDQLDHLGGIELAAGGVGLHAVVDGGLEAGLEDHEVG